MAPVSDLLEKIFTLTSNVQSLLRSVDKIEAILRDHHERIIKLESREEVLMERAKSAASQAAITTIMSLNKMQARSLNDQEDNLGKLTEQ